MDNVVDVLLFVVMQELYILLKYTVLLLCINVSTYYSSMLDNFPLLRYVMYRYILIIGIIYNYTAKSNWYFFLYEYWLSHLTVNSTITRVRDGLARIWCKMVHFLGPHHFFWKMILSCQKLTYTVLSSKLIKMQFEISAQ